MRKPILPFTALVCVVTFVAIVLPDYLSLLVGALICLVAEILFRQIISSIDELIRQKQAQDSDPRLN